MCQVEDSNPGGQALAQGPFLFFDPSLITRDLRGYRGDIYF
jgi:hypothetical protein